MFSCSGTIVLTSTLSINDSLRIDGSGQTIILSGDDLVRVVSIGIGHNVTINNLTIANGYCEICFGAGIVNSGNLTLTNVTFTGNAAHTGGALYNNENATLSVSFGVFAGNAAHTSNGGGIYNHVDAASATVTNSVFSNNTAALDGGGIYSRNDLSVSNSTFAQNSAVRDGGGIFMAAGADNPVAISNSTLTGNSAGDRGGGVFDNGEALNIIQSTIAGNTGGAGLYAWDSSGNGPVVVSNSLISNNAGDNCVNNGLGETDFIINSYSIASDASCDESTTRTVDEIKLGALSNHGGFTQTMPLGVGSAAIDVGDPAFCTSFDQRGVARPLDGNADGTALCDAGAYEAQIAHVKSQGAIDGWVLESDEFSKQGGALNKKGKVINIGDDAFNRQYRALLSFNTSSIPTDAVITTVTLRVKRKGVTGGGNPVNIFKGFMVDVKKGNFGTTALQLTDFQTKGNKTLGAFKPALSGGWYTLNLTNGKNQINKNGNTQIRLRFKLDDNNNAIASFLKIHSGNAGAANRPQLIVEYFIP